MAGSTSFTFFGCNYESDIDGILCWSALKEDLWKLRYDLLIYLIFVGWQDSHYAILLFEMPILAGKKRELRRCIEIFFMGSMGR